MALNGRVHGALNLSEYGTGPLRGPEREADQDGGVQTDLSVVKKEYRVATSLVAGELSADVQICRAAIGAADANLIGFMGSLLDVVCMSLVAAAGGRRGRERKSRRDTDNGEHTDKPPAATSAPAVPLSGTSKLLRRVPLLHGVVVASVKCVVLWCMHSAEGEPFSLVPYRT